MRGGSQSQTRLSVGLEDIPDSVLDLADRKTDSRDEVLKIVRQICAFVLVAALTAPGLAGQAQPVASLSGTVLGSNGQPLPNVAVQVRDLATGQVVARTTTSAEGQYSFVGLNPGSYVVEVVSADRKVVGASGPVSIAASATVTGVTVTASAAALAAAAAGGASGISTAVAIAAVAAAAGVVGIVTSSEPPSPSR
jgi:hypothetical protein